ncbi:hypothetical protein BAZMOX_04655_2 [methanotrophic endosymbiont of Bathymodiolus azoricus (Menez Gwen)]|nr:hypothetical protein BAZMOX_04655_2 [methanotrophic endosymbiont of Bathymodiolus azoricus (Menez Gwen)]
MQANVGGIDKTIRIIAVGAYFQSWSGGCRYHPSYNRFN